MGRARWRHLNLLRFGGTHLNGSCWMTRSMAGEVRREGFPEMTPAEFVEFFCRSHSGCTADLPLTRLEFSYI